MELAVTNLPITKVTPNPWNPNKQTERQYAAEMESICDNGFVMPIIVRKHPEKKGYYEIVDGEHRWKALQQIAVENKKGKGNVPSLVENKEIPAIVLSIDEAKAKRLTVIMNETRGRADLTSLGTLLAELAPELGDDLIIGLPYTPEQLNEILDIAKFDWTELETPIDGEELYTQEEEAYKVVAVLDNETQLKWQNAMALKKQEFPSDSKVAAGLLIKELLESK
jgi:ParB-like chromosome segregation protein Spo0J